MSESLVRNEEGTRSTGIFDKGGATVHIKSKGKQEASLTY